MMLLRRLFLFNAGVLVFTWGLLPTMNQGVRIFGLTFWERKHWDIWWAVAIALVLIELAWFLPRLQKKLANQSGFLKQCLIAFFDYDPNKESKPPSDQSSTQR